MKKTSLTMIGLVLSAAVLPAFAAVPASAVIELPPTVVTGKAPEGSLPPPPPPADADARDHQGPHGGFKGPGRDGGPFKQLDLTQEQKDKIKSIIESHKESTKAEIDAVLTPEQREKLLQVMAKKREHRESHGRHFQLQQDIRDKKAE